MKTPAQFYKQIGADKLMSRKKITHTKNELVYLKKYLNKKQSILDLGCGYGRFTNILARQGYKIEGIDISSNLITKAKKIAKSENLNVKFKIGDMRKLPYKDNSFDALICMWSVFAELPKEKDQIKSLKEMLRVLENGGLAFLDLPEPQRIKTKTITHFIGNTKGIPMFNHNKTTLKNLMFKIKPKKYKIFIDNFGGRNRLLVIVWK